MVAKSVQQGIVWILVIFLVAPIILGGLALLAAILGWILRG
jgi:hypothetical protein